MNKIVKGKCIDISSEGKGVVKNGRDIYFVDGLFPGEEADINVLYQRAGVYFGKVAKLYKLSKDRIQPKCKVCTICGGCQYQQINYEKQLEFKTNRVKNALERIAHIKGVEIKPCIGMENPYFYRNKIQMPYGKDRKGSVVYGFFKENSNNQNVQIQSGFSNLMKINHKMESECNTSLYYSACQKAFLYLLNMIRRFGF